MGTDLSGAPGMDAKFWDGFLEVVRAQGVRAPYERWYVIRAEQYLKMYPVTPLSGHRPEEVSGYLEEIGRKGSLKDWQFRQVVDALEALFCKVVVAPWAGGFDWGY